MIERALIDSEIAQMNKRVFEDLELGEWQLNFER